MAVGYRATCSSRPYSVPSGFREKMSCKTTIFSSSHSSIKNRTRPWIREMLSHLIINLYTNYGHCFTLVALVAVGLGSWIAPLSVPQNPPVPGVTQHLQENRQDVVAQRVWHFLLLILAFWVRFHCCQSSGSRARFSFSVWSRQSWSLDIRRNRKIGFSVLSTLCI